MKFGSCRICHPEDPPHVVVKTQGGEASVCQKCGESGIYHGDPDQIRKEISEMKKTGRWPPKTLGQRLDAIIDQLQQFRKEIP